MGHMSYWHPEFSPRDDLRLGLKSSRVDENELPETRVGRSSVFQLPITLSVSISPLMRRRREEKSPCSSIGSSDQPCPSNVRCSIERDVITELRLGIKTSSAARLERFFDERGEYPRDWPPLKSLLRNALAGREAQRKRLSFFVKVYMEGQPIGRKVDLFAHQGYEQLLRTLGRMFRIVITCPDLASGPCKETLVLTYEDKEGDWMVVGDVPWEIFLSSVTRLKITPAEKC